MKNNLKMLLLLICTFILSQSVFLCTFGIDENTNATLATTASQILYIIINVFINFMVWYIVTKNSNDNIKTKIIKIGIEIVFLLIGFFAINNLIYNLLLYISNIALCIYKIIKSKDKECSKEDIITIGLISIILLVIAFVISFQFMSLYEVWVNSYTYIAIILSGISLVFVFKICFSKLFMDISKIVLIIFAILLLGFTIYNIGKSIEIGSVYETLRTYTTEMDESKNSVSATKATQEKYKNATENYGNKNSIFIYNRYPALIKEMVNTNYNVFKNTNSIHLGQNRSYIENFDLIFDLFLLPLKQMQNALILNIIFMYIIAGILIIIFKNNLKKINKNKATVNN